MSAWDLVAAVDYAWKELRAMPLSPSATVVPYWLSTLKSLSLLCDALHDGRDAAMLASTKHDLSINLMSFYLAGNAVEQSYYERIREGFRDAGEEVNQW